MTVKYTLDLFRSKIDVFVIPLPRFRGEIDRLKLLRRSYERKLNAEKCLREVNLKDGISHLSLPLPQELCPFRIKFNRISLTLLYVPFAAHAISDVIRVLH